MRLALLAALLQLASAGSGRFNKAFCLSANNASLPWGNVSFWNSLITHNTTRVIQLSTVNASGVFYLAATPNSSSPFASLALSPSPSNLSLDLGCELRAWPHYSTVALGTHSPPRAPQWARGPLGDAAKVPRCWFVRCDVTEAEADFCGSEGEAPCTKLASTFVRYTAPEGPAVVDTACYNISLDSQVDAAHRVDFAVRFVDGLT